MTIKDAAKKTKILNDYQLQVYHRSWGLSTVALEDRHQIYETEINNKTEKKAKSTATDLAKKTVAHGNLISKVLKDKWKTKGYTLWRACKYTTEMGIVNYYTIELTPKEHFNPSITHIHPQERKTIEL